MALEVLEGKITCPPRGVSVVDGLVSTKELVTAVPPPPTHIAHDVAGVAPAFDVHDEDRKRLTPSEIGPGDRQRAISASGRNIRVNINKLTESQ